ncbi:hypothetical protein [Secundilactobacillus odoratitofui]|uniref:hypothetical protein n=1 Tax=Secundilactobacillus odoratitofui TaxID=480930 RepID=UPI000A71EDC1
MTEQTIQLADGNTMPLVGFGTYLINTQELMDQSIKTAFDAAIAYLIPLSFTVTKTFWARR